MNKHYCYPVIIEFPSQFQEVYLENLCSSDLIILGTKTGSTDEILSLAKILNKNKNIIVGFIGDDRTPIDNFVHYKIQSYMTDVHLSLLWIFILSLTNYSDISNFIEEVKLLKMI